MGQNFSSEPVVEKDTERDHNDTFNVAVSSCQGWRMSQEDNHTMMLELPGNHKAAFFAVYDGHGSARVSKHASESLWRHLTENELYIKGKFKEALETAFLTFDREVNASYNAQLAGTTAICLLVVDNVIYCANIGDSRAVASVNCQCVPLSYDHKPENPQELKRILAAGGYVLGNRVNGNLALSRAFGDFHYKGNDQLPPEQQIVSPCPDIKTIELNNDVDFLVLACDGIWDVLSNEEVVEFVISRLEDLMEPGIICEQLTTRCLATDYELVIGCDNMTVLLVCYTRGRSWAEYCADVYRNNSSRMGILRTPPDFDPEYSRVPSDPFEVPADGEEVRDGLQPLDQQQSQSESEQQGEENQLSPNEPEEHVDHKEEQLQAEPDRHDEADQQSQNEPEHQKDGPQQQLQSKSEQQYDGKQQTQDELGQQNDEEQQSQSEQPEQLIDDQQQSNNDPQEMKSEEKEEDQKEREQQTQDEPDKQSADQQQDVPTDESC